MLPIFENTSRQKWEDFIHQRNFNTLANAVDDDEDRFAKIVCLQPICDSTNRDYECRKAQAVQHLINGISLHGAVWIDTAFNFCSCDAALCDCSREMPTEFPTSIFFGD